MTAFTKRANGLTKHQLVLLLVFFTGLIGVAIHRDYGIPWDEAHQRDLGAASYDYITGSSNRYLSLVIKEYGVIYELALNRLEKLVGPDVQAVYFGRHLATHLVFLGSGCFFYLLVYELTSLPLLAVLGFLIYVAHPKIYADSFYNTKDIPFMAMQPVCYWLFARACKTLRSFDFGLFGFAIGLQLALRVMGMMPACAGLLLIAGGLTTVGNDRALRWRYCRGILVYLSVAALTTYFVWPYLWLNPFANLKHAFQVMSQYPWGGTILFNGQMIKASEEPWYYGLVWFLITTPPAYLVLGLISLGLGLGWMWSHCGHLHVLGWSERCILYALIGFAGPFVSVLCFRSVLYDSWRHLYFVYPGFVLLVVIGIHSLRGRLNHWCCLGLALAGIASTIWFMVENHPHENVYFNRLAGPQEQEYIRHHWDMDYWGLSFKQGLEHVLLEDHSPIVKICSSSVAAGNNIYILSPKQRSRVQFVDAEQASYFMTNYRDHANDYLTPMQLIYKVTSCGGTVLAVYRINSPSPKIIN